MFGIWEKGLANEPRQWLNVPTILEQQSILADTNLPKIIRSNISNLDGLFDNSSGTMALNYDCTFELEW